MDDPREALRALVRERDDVRRVASRQPRLRDQAQAARDAVGAANARVVAVGAELGALQRLTPARVLATLTGRRGTEVADARRRLADARAALEEQVGRRDALQTEAADAESAVRRLAGVDQRLAEATPAVEARLRAQGSAEERAELDRARSEVDRAQTELTELAEARVVADEAVDRLAEATELLASAQAWSTWDTWGGGDVVSSLVKHDRLDRSLEPLRAAAQAIERLTAELADVDIEPPPGLRLDAGTRFWDVWLDNLVTDLRVHREVRATVQRVGAARHDVRHVLGVLALRRQLVERDLRAAEHRREELLLRG